MGSSSTVSLQSVVDFIATMGGVTPVLPTGGYTTLAALTNANDVMIAMLAKPFNWKWNSFKVPPFYTNSWQSDYAQINQTNLGWLENCRAVDINNTSVPKPICYPETVRQLERTSWAGSPPDKVCWMYNSTLDAGIWPGNSQVYTQPVGRPQMPQNPPTVIMDANGNLLVLTIYGTTAATGSGPLSATPWSSAQVTTIQDGTCVWTVANPNGQGFRVSPLPPQSGVVYQMNVTAQAKPPTFTMLSQKINPVPDEYQSYFREGMIAYTYRIANDPGERAKFPGMRQMWLASLAEACKQGDREPDDASFIPQSTIMGDGSYGGTLGPADPFNWLQRGWRN